MRLPDDTIRYIIRFLLGEGNEALASLVSYGETDDESVRLVVIPAPPFSDGSPFSALPVPSTPLPLVEQTPLLFGDPVVQPSADGRLRIYADIIASSWFLLADCEPQLSPPSSFDRHGRFVGKSSLSARAGFLDVPLVDRYGVLLRSWLRAAAVHVAEPSPAFSAVNLTTDLDAPFFSRSLRSLCRELLYASPLRHGKGYPLHALRSLMGKTSDDPFFTLPLLTSLRGRLQQSLHDECMVRQWLFVRSLIPGTTDSPFDSPRYSLQDRDLQFILHYCRSNGINVGLHVSYSAADNPSPIAQESIRLQQAVHDPVCHTRFHYLRFPSRPSADIAQCLVRAGITDDWSPAYADKAGFRLGTSRPVRYIDPLTGTLLPLTLHPLTIMDCTLSDPAYMHLSEEEAVELVIRLARQVRTHRGEFNLLFHNHTLAAPYELARMDNNYHRRLLQAIPHALKNSPVL